MNIETFISRYAPCNQEELMAFATVAEAWEAETTPSNLMWAACIVDPSRSRVLLADMLTVFSLPVWLAAHPDDDRVRQAIEACRTGDWYIARAAADASCDAADAAYAARAAYADATRAAYAAMAADWAARAAAYAAAKAAARAAAWAANAATYAAYAADGGREAITAYIKTRATWVADLT